MDPMGKPTKWECNVEFEGRLRKEHDDVDGHGVYLEYDCHHLPPTTATTTTTTTTVVD